MTQTVGIAMSGGIDSSCTAILLKEMGYNVIGFTFKPYIIDNSSKENTESIMHYSQAVQVADKLEIEHRSLDLSSDFKREVIEPFVKGYSKGLTPNPCMICNQKIKWGILRQKMFESGCEFMATGHYARIEKTDGAYILKKGIDSAKEQSYFLYFLTQELMSRTLLPMGDLTKKQAMKIVAKLGINLEDRGESQDLCFIGSKDDFMSLFKTRSKGSGDIVDIDGNILGKHQGLEKYTVGQRRGLDIAHSERLYVLEKDAENNRLVVGEIDSLKRDSLKISSFTVSHPNCPEPESESISCEVKYRYRTPAKTARFTRNSETDGFIEFDKPVAGIAPGQIAVVYRGDEVVGGGIIE